MPVDAVSPPEIAREKSRSLRPDLILLAVCALAAVPMLYLALTQFVEYDGFWHVFIAQQDNWKNFLFDYKHNDHPLLFYLVLRVLLRFGRSVLLYRSVSIASALGSVYLVGKIAQKLSSSRLVPPVTALAFGLAMPTIEIALSVRSYMLSILFVLLSFYYLLDLLPAAGGVARTRARAVCALALVLAAGSHYFTFFYIAACAVVLVGFSLFSGSAGSWKMWLAHALTFAPVGWVMRYFYRTHIRLHLATGETDYLGPFRFVGHESIPAFFIRNLQNLFNFLAPWQITDRALFLAVIVGLAASGIGIMVSLRSRAALPLLMLAILVGELAVAGYLGKYPFGGLLRQQFILFPFAVLSAGIYLDRIFSFFPARSMTAAVAMLLFGSTIAVSAIRFHAFPKLRGELFTREMNLYDAAVPSRAVLLDQFSLIAFFTHHHQWQWRFTRRLPMSTAVDDYTIERGNERLTVLRDRTRWNFEFTDPAFLHDAADTLRAAKLDSLGVFCIHQSRGERSPAEEEAYQQKVFALAEVEHLQIRRFVPDGLNVYAEFSLAAPQ